MRYLILITLILQLKSFAQFNIEEGQSLDRILAVVGKEKILKSEIDAQMARMQQMNPSTDFFDDRVRSQILKSLIDEKLIVLKAKEDSIEVSDAEVEARWSQLVEQWKVQYGNLQRVEALYQKSLSEIKFDSEEQIRDQILAMKLQQTKFGTVTITPSEVKRFYEDYKDSLEVVGDKYKIAHIVRNIEANRDVKKKSYQKAMDIRDSLLEGITFEELAKRNSQDPNTAADGGNLGWFDKGRLFPEFENAAFALQKGETSLPIETPFGFHLIQTLEKKETSINTRHILIKIDEGIDKTEETKKGLIALKDSIKNGVEFADLALRFSQDESTKGFGGVMGELTYEALPPSYRTAVENLEIGEVSDPIPYNVEEGKPALALIKVIEFIPSHKMNIEKDYETIENYAKSFKQRKQMSEWVQTLRDQLYWEMKEY